ncbi:MAG: ABC transporter permease subunit [Chloroflexi bacterium]|nr:ABC transporter permease subunit [Chloroflexota bacterium]
MSLTPNSPTKKQWLVMLLIIALLINALVLAVGQWGLSLDNVSLVESTPGQLSLWVAGQTEASNPESFLAILAKPTVAGGVLSETAALQRARLTLTVLGLIVAGLAIRTAIVLQRQPASGRTSLVWLLLGYVVLLLNIPPLVEYPFYGMILAGIALTIVTLAIAPGHFTPQLGFLVIVCGLLGWWEIYKLLGNATGNLLPLTDFPWKLPHWQSVAKALLLPARRNGPHLLLRILAAAGLVTGTEAVMGFTVGSLLGFGLGTLFAHSPRLERGLLPYVIASQTIPIIAIAPMIVAWIGQGRLSVAVISAYLAFFPVTINTLRGLLSPDTLKLDLMHSFAASRSTILWKLRVPSALPYLFSALKVAATACVVGAIVGELPSSRSDGLAAAILRASGNYAAQPEKLWAAIIMASLVGILFFSLISLIEQRVLRGFVATR